LNFDATRGPKLYIVSQKRDPEPELATALADYDAFVRALNEYVVDVEDVLDGDGRRSGACRGHAGRREARADPRADPVGL